MALANKNVRILWAVLAKGRAFATNQVPTKPGEIIRPVAAVRRHGSKVLSVSRTIDFPHEDVRSKMHHAGQTDGRQARLTLCRAHSGDDDE